jgi:proline dehydrogenase
MLDVAQALKGAALRAWEPLSQRASRSYVAGPSLEDALRTCRRLKAARMGSTVCFWNPEDAAPRTVADEGLAALSALYAEGHDFYVSVKAPALGYAPDLVEELAARAGAMGVRLHFDAQRLSTIDRTLPLLLRARDASRGPIGLALPGRYLRSTRDALWAAEQGLFVRVVKGQQPDPAAPDLDLRAGFLSVIDALAGRARFVAVGSHDAPLVREALSRLASRGTPCELELLLGLPFGPALTEARALGVPVRVYVPYGSGRLPYHLSDARRDPRIFTWLLRDLRGRPPEAAGIPPWW